LVLVPDGRNIVEQWKTFKRRKGNGGAIELIGLESEENRSDAGIAKETAVERLS
jgi:hypothetical protein